MSYWVEHPGRGRAAEWKNLSITAREDRKHEKMLGQRGKKRAEAFKNWAKNRLKVEKDG